MENQIYSIYDRATKTYSNPFYCSSYEDCLRSIRGALSPASQLVLYPSDYVICNLGSWDSDIGRIDFVEPAEIQEIKNLIPVGLRQYVLDGTFDGGVSNETKKNSPA